MFVRKRGNKWEYRFYHNGREVSKCGYKLKREAEAAGIQRQLDISGGSPVRLHDLFDRWIATKDYAESTVQARTYSFYKHSPGNLLIRDMTCEDCQTVINNCGSPNMQKMLLAVYRQMFLFARNNGMTENNPAESCSVKKQRVPLEKKSHVLLDPDPIIGRIEDVNDQFFFYLACKTGLRAGELLGLFASDYDGEWLNISRQLTAYGVEAPLKTLSSYRKVYVDEELRPILCEKISRMKHYGFEKKSLCCNDAGDVISRSHIRYTFKKYGVHIHQCRHYCATVMAKAGVPEYIIRDCLGHVPTSITQSYLDTTDDDIRAAFSKVSGQSTGNLLENLRKYAI